MPISSELKGKCILCGDEIARLLFIKNGFNIVQCCTCDLVYVGNPPSNEELRKYYSFDSGYHFDYHDDNHSKFKNKIYCARKYYNLVKMFKTSGRILDVGCSVGFFLDIAKNNGWETYGIELNADTAKIARERYGLQVFTGTLNEVSCPATFFDVITLWDVIEHVENPLHTMQIINQKLKKDGIVAFETPNINGLFPMLSYKIANTINFWTHPEPPAHLFQFSKETISNLLNLSGFEILKIYDTKIPIEYSLPFWHSINLFFWLYAIIFAPFALIGPLFHMGDSIIVIAKKCTE